MSGSAGAFDLFQDICGFGGPDKRLGIFIVMVDVIADCQDQVLDASKDAAAQPILSQVAEESSTMFSHEQPVGVKCMWKRGWRLSQSWTLGCLWVA